MLLRLHSSTFSSLLRLKFYLGVVLYISSIDVLFI
jgi:hypothetical protein